MCYCSLQYVVILFCVLLQSPIFGATAVCAMQSPECGATAVYATAVSGML